MLHIVRALIACGLVFITGSAAAESATAETFDKPNTSGWAIGFGIGSFGPASRVDIDFRSPVLLSVDRDRFFAGDYSLVFGFDTYLVNNASIEGDDSLQQRSANLASLGLRTELFSIDQSAKVYGSYELLYLSPDKELSDLASMFGGRLAFGGELPGAIVTNGFGKSVYSAIFVQADLTAGFGRANKQPGKPNLFNGVGVSVGARTYF